VFRESKGYRDYKVILARMVLQEKEVHRDNKVFKD